MSLRTLIVDDEELARQWLRRRLEDHPDVEVVGEACDGTAAVAAVARLQPDLVFLDVQMPELDGFAALERLGSRRPQIIFLTAHGEHAVRAFEVEAADYIVKPVDPERLGQAIERVRRRRGNRAETSGLADMIKDLRRTQRPPRLLVRSGNRSFFLSVQEVDWVESQANYVLLHVGRRVYPYRETTSRLETLLDPEQFLRIHRSTIVNIDRIQELEPLPGGEYRVTLKDGTQLMLSESYRHRLVHFRRLPEPAGEERVGAAAADLEAPAR
jgi:two-component system LytT family response regulator